MILTLLAVSLELGFLPALLFSFSPSLIISFGTALVLIGEPGPALLVFAIGGAFLELFSSQTAGVLILGLIGYYLLLKAMTDRLIILPLKLEPYLLLSVGFSLIFYLAFQLFLDQRLSLALVVVVLIKSFLTGLASTLFRLFVTNVANRPKERPGL